MECFDVRNELLELDGIDYSDLETLPENTRAHIENCDDCRTYLAELSEMKALINAAIPVPCKNGVTLHEHLAGRIASGDTKPALLKPKHRFFPVATLAAVAAVVAVVFVGGFPIGDLANKFAGVQENDTPGIMLADESFDYAAEQQGAEDTNGVVNGDAAQFKMAKAEGAEAKAYEDSAATQESVGVKSKLAGNFDGVADYAAAGETTISYSLKARTTSVTDGDLASGASGSTGATTAAYNPSKNSHFDALPEESVQNAPPMMVAMLPDEESEESDGLVIAEAELQAEEAKICESIDSVLEAAKLYFEQNGCVHEDGRHEISREMAQTVGESEFVKWYNESAVHDLPTLYTIESFKKHFGIE